MVVPTCGRLKALGCCLEALEASTRSLRESVTIVVSEDGMADVAAASLQQVYPSVVFTTGPRRGPAANRNHGARQTQCDWIVFTDDDCVPSAGWIEAFMSAAKEPGLYEGRTTSVAMRNTPLETAPVSSGGTFWTCNLMVHRSVFDAVGGFDERFPYPAMEDIDFRERCRSAGYPMFYVEDAVVDHPPVARASLRKHRDRVVSTLIYESIHGKRLGSMSRDVRRLVQALRWYGRSSRWGDCTRNLLLTAGEIWIERFERRRLKEVASNHLEMRSSGRSAA